MIDWTRYPKLVKFISNNGAEEIDRLRTDVRQAERERCADVCRGLTGQRYLDEEFEAGQADGFDKCATAIEALGDEDGAQA